MESLTYNEHYFIEASSSYAHSSDEVSHGFSDVDRSELTFEEKYFFDDEECDFFNWQFGYKKCNAETAHEENFLCDQNLEFVQDSIDQEKVFVVAQNLKQLIRNFKECQESCKKFLKAYPAWSESRRRSITELNEIAETLDTTKFGCNVGKIVGSSVGATGGILTVTGAALIPFTAGISSPLMIGGVVTSLLGGTTSLSVAITETVVLKNKVQAAQDVLKRDEMEFHNMSEWFQHTASYIEAINKLLNFTIFSKIVADSEKVFSVLTAPAETKSPGDRPSTVRNSIIMKKLLPLIGSSMALPEINLLYIIVTNPNLIEMFREIIRLHCENPLLFEAAAITARICVQIVRGVDVSADFITTAIKTANLGSVTFGASVTKAISQGLFAGLGLAIDVTSLVLASIDVHNGSKCTSAEKIREANKQLNDEFNIIKSIYKELVKCEVY